MLLSEQGMNRARSLASEIVRVNKEQEIKRYMLERERRAQATKNSLESLGRTIRNVQDAYIEGFIKPINNAMKSMRKGFYS